MTFNFEEAVYASLCHIFGSEDDQYLSTSEQNSFNAKFLERHYLSDEAIRAIAHKWGKANMNDFFYEITESFNQCSYTRRLEGLKTLGIIMNSMSRAKECKYAWHQIREGMNISKDAYDEYVRN